MDKGPSRFLLRSAAAARSACNPPRAAPPMEPPSPSSFLGDVGSVEALSGLCRRRASVGDNDRGLPDASQRSRRCSGKELWCLWGSSPKAKLHKKGGKESTVVCSRPNNSSTVPTRNVAAMQTSLVAFISVPNLTSMAAKLSRCFLKSLKLSISKRKSSLNCASLALRSCLQPSISLLTLSTINSRERFMLCLRSPMRDDIKDSTRSYNLAWPSLSRSNR
mmetsp:Transcript_44687/g.118271  ORF Transcript_44687/g.118271 Transcript_44687/m.118271 type:complete len:220 (+) Transcript_44687:82-741(+)